MTRIRNSRLPVWFDYEHFISQVFQLILFSLSIACFVLNRGAFARSGAPLVRKFGYLCTKDILVLAKSCVHKSTPSCNHVSGCQMAHFDTICGIGHPRYSQLTAVKKGICWPVSYDCIAGSGIQLEQVTYFLSYPLTSFWFQIDRLRSVFLKVEFSLLSAYGKSWITWERHYYTSLKSFAFDLD